MEHCCNAELFVLVQMYVGYEPAGLTVHPPPPE